LSWYYAKNGQRHGPYEPAELRRLAAVGSFTANDLIWQAGASQWVRAGSIQGLFPAGPPPTDAPADDDALPSVTEGPRRRTSQPSTRGQRRRREFPALSIVAGICVFGSVLCIGLSVITAVLIGASDLPITAKVFQGIVSLVVGAFLAVVYLASAEMIRWAIYVARLLEEIRDNL